MQLLLARHAANKLQHHCDWVTMCMAVVNICTVAGINLVVTEHKLIAAAEFK